MSDIAQNEQSSQSDQSDRIDRIHRNKQIAQGFFDLAFNDKLPVEAVAKYVGSTYIQHNPQAPDGSEAFIRFVTEFGTEFPELSMDFMRVLAEDDLVVLHSLMRTSPDDRGTALVDIVRIRDGRIVEHWDVIQPIPETSANDNTMF
ncbi:ester cyclase [Embleya sp. NBC_00896]|uniref:nuclear transport factor 2 family protein n=1 Tax=Embleya sp. NBC_00896 TaxID=2975961 RepID=UPI002F90CBD1|nr:ester cyclase [Embleya sp. NBC_00896]